MRKEKGSVSIIVPVFNAQEQIGRCLLSILKQNFHNFECIVIDDGSTDKSGEICDQYAAKYDKVRVIHTKNRGQGLARNTGLKQAAGEYVYFVDADDRVLPDGLAALMTIAERKPYDVIAGGYYRMEGKNRKLAGSGYTQGEVARKGSKEKVNRYHQIKTSSLFGYLWNKIYRRDFLLARGLYLDDIKKIYMEDTLFNLKVFSENPSYYLCTEPVYEYNAGGASTTRKAEPKIAEKYARLLDNYCAYLQEKGRLRENKDLLVSLAMRTFCWSLVKNIPYEGISFRKLMKRIAIFMGNPAFRFIVKDRESIRLIGKIRILPERLFYSFLLLLLRRGHNRVLAYLFVLLEPVMMLYIKVFLK